MIAVTDTSPLNYLIRLGVPGILGQIYGGILVPPAVLRELKHPAAPKEVRSWALSPPPWLQVLRVQDMDSTLNRTLGIGEREAISLAVQVGADVLILDDFKARVAAMKRGIRVAGTIAVLREASLRNQLRFSDAIETIREFGFRITAKTVNDALVEYEELRRNKKE